MLIHNSAELKAALLPKIEESVRKTQEQVYEIIKQSLMKFYTEFTPQIYFRTQQLFNSLVKSEITETPNGYKAEVYFDLNAMNYTVKKFKSGKYSSSGKIYGNKGWSGAEEMVFGGVKGLHGYRGKDHSIPITGTAFWLDPKTEIDGKIIDMLLSNLKAAGIPIR